jgi:DNA helicase-2/ATP-dependent DNA helicase PcrA
VIGPPGTGKTQFAKQIIIDLVKKGINPSKIIFTSFTRSAANEARRRCMDEFPQYNYDDFRYFKTVHGICYNLLNLSRGNVFTGKHLEEFAKQFNYEITIDVNNGDQYLCDPMVITDGDAYINFDEWRVNNMYFSIDLMGVDFKYIYNEFVKQRNVLPQEFCINGFRRFYERKTQYKQQHNLWEFSDMLVKVLMDGIKPDAEVIISDEHQDASPLIHAVIDMWAENMKEVYILGDPDQCIYQWSGADPSIMIDWKRDDDIVLKQSYRCSKAVHDLSRVITDRMKLRYHSDFIPTDRQGSIFIVYSPNYESAYPTFVAARTRYLLEKHYQEVMRQLVPFVAIRGRKSPLEKSYKDAVIVMQKLINGDYVTLNDIYVLSNHVPQKMWLKYGSKTIIKSEAEKDPDKLITKSMMYDLGFTNEFMSIINDTDFLVPLSIPPEEKTYYRKMIKKYGTGILFEKPKVVLGTIHSFKGLEADRVILDLELTALPALNLESNSDSEHRVFYTGVTRAKEIIELLVSGGRYGYDLR